MYGTVAEDFLLVRCDDQAFSQFFRYKIGDPNPEAIRSD